MLFVCYPKCSTCMKAKKWLEEKEIEFEQRDIKEEKPTAEELKTWWRKSGLPLKTLQRNAVKRQDSEYE